MTTTRQSDGLWPRFGAMVTIVMTLLGWSSVPLFLRHFSGMIDVWTSNGWRYGMSALLWLPVLVVGVARKRLPRRLWRAALVPAAINCVSQMAFCWTFYTIDPGLATFGLRSNIVFATIGAAVLFANERRVVRSRGFLVGLGMVVGGTLGTMVLGQSLPRGATLVGIVLAVSSGAGFAAYALAVRHYMKGIDAITSFAAISLYTAVGMVGLMVVLGEGAGVRAIELLRMPLVVGGVGVPGGQFTFLFLSAVVGIALGHVFYYYSISRLGVAVSAGVVQLQPFIVSLASHGLFGEVLTGPQWACGSVAIMGAGVMLLVQHRLNRRSREPFAELPPDAVAASALAESDRPGR
ncbi:MAG: DMT family transporter [Phycisphaerae bacterium]|nr:DMT family transporter [Phycisphaerae bacterium]